MFTKAFVKVTMCVNTMWFEVDVTAITINCNYERAHAMKAMILAAGKGTRVRPLTNEMPKPMIPIIGKPVMEYLIEELERHGFDEIMINVSHLPEKIESYFGNGERLGVEIGYSFEGYIEDGEIQSEALGSAGGIKRIQDFGGFLMTHF